MGATSFTRAKILRAKPLVVARPAHDNTRRWPVARGDEGRFRQPNPAGLAIYLFDVRR